MMGEDCCVYVKRLVVCMVKSANGIKDMYEQKIPTFYAQPDA